MDGRLSDSGQSRGATVSTCCNPSCGHGCFKKRNLRVFTVRASVLPRPPLLVLGMGKKQPFAKGTMQKFRTTITVERANLGNLPQQVGTNAGVGPMPRRCRRQALNTLAGPGREAVNCWRTGIVQMLWDLGPVKQWELAAGLRRAACPNM